MLKLLFSFLLIIFWVVCYSQQYNSDPNKSYINIKLPKTPESQAFERYGDFSVNELLGLPNISIPIYSVQSKLLSAPITLSYHAEGIKVSQEASWVGLGFNLMAGGRITADVRGRIDNAASANSFGMIQVKQHVPAIFNRFGNSSNRDVYTPATVCEGFAECSQNPTPGYDNRQAVWSMAAYGLGEPDIYTASFNGSSFKFYFDLIDGSLKFIGEKNLYKIYPETDQYGLIDKWVIVDTKGISYFFQQKEVSKVITPPQHDPNSYRTTTAWLLTKMQYATDSIVFRYTNYGEVAPAYEWTFSYSGSYGGSTSPSNPMESYLNRVKTEPAYLTQIESPTCIVNFNVSNRNDIEGNAKKLDEITVITKLNNKEIRKWKFDYEYFTGHLDPIMANRPETEKTWSRLRLKLTSLTLKNDVSQNNPYKFYYDTSSVAIPGKYSFAQDHWGFLNNPNHNIGNDPNPSPSALVPSISSLLSEGVEIAPSNHSSWIQSGFGVRTCNPNTMKTMMMDSIVYPTGGSTKFEYGPHKSRYFGNSSLLTGGGLRIEKIKNYNGPGKSVQEVIYTYEDGVYQGRINYLNIYNTLDVNCPSCNAQIYTNYTLSARGTYNKADVLVNYARVIQKRTDADNQMNNGTVIKYYHLTTPYEMSGLLPNLFGPHMFYSSSLCYQNTGYFDCPEIHQLKAPYYCLPPTPRENLDGKMYKEEYLNSNGTIQKSVEYYYKQVGYSQNFFSIKVRDHLTGGVFNTSGEVYGAAGWLGGYRRYLMVLSPAKSYFTQLDSIIEKDYNGSEFTKRKKVNYYNSANQIEFESNYVSDGTQLITYTQTPLSFNRPNVPSAGEGDAFLIEQMKSANFIDFPIEQITLKRTITGDTVVTGGVYYVYDGPLMKKVYKLATRQPLAFRSQFKPVYYLHNYPVLPSFYATKDLRYELVDSVDYVNLLPTNRYTISSNISFIWSEKNNVQYPVAKAINASGNEIFFESFEETGKWDAAMSSIDAGNKRTGLSSGKIDKPTPGEQISRSSEWINLNLSASKKFKYSGWAYSTGPSAEIFVLMRRASDPTGGFSTFKQVYFPLQLNKWVYIEDEVIIPSDVTQVNLRVDNNGGGTVWFDDIRFHPSEAYLTTYTYQQGGDITSQTDANNRTTYYSYDGFSRLQMILDHDYRVLKKICYNYNGQTEDCTSPVFFNDLQQQTFTSTTNCSAGTWPATYTYSVPANIYSSSIDKAIANQMALQDLTTNGQAAANALGCITAVNGWNKTNSLWQVNISNSSGYSNTITFYPGSSSGFLANLPVGTYNFTITPVYTQSTPVQLIWNGSTTYTGTSFSLTNIAVTTTTTITIQDPPPSGPCSFTMSSGYSSPTNSITNNGTTVSFYMVFYPGSSMYPGMSYFVATVNGSCRPSSTRTINFSSSGRNWTITINSNGQMYWYLNPGSSPVNAYSTVSTSTLTYTL